MENKLFFEIYKDFINIKKNIDLDSISNFLIKYSRFRSRHVFKDLMLSDSKFNNCEEYLDNEIFNLLSLPYKEYSIGDTLIKDYLIRGDNIDYMTYLWDCESVKKNLGIEDDIKFQLNYFDNKEDCCGDVDFQDKTINIKLIDDNKFDCYMDGNLYNLLTIRHELKHYYQYNYHSYKNDLEGLYFKFSKRLINVQFKDNTNLYDIFHDFYPFEFDSDLFSYYDLRELLYYYDDTRLYKYLDEVNGFMILRDTCNDEMFDFLKTFKYGEDLANNYINIYHGDLVDNCALDENGYDKANLLPLMYILTDYMYYSLIEGNLEDEWKNYAKLYDAIDISNQILKLFPEYNKLLDKNTDNIIFTKFKLFDIYNDASDVVKEWQKVNHIEECEYNSDYYSGTLGSEDMQRELNIMYLEYLIKNKKDKAKNKTV